MLRRRLPSKCRSTGTMGAPLRSAAVPSGTSANAAFTMIVTRSAPASLHDVAMQATGPTPASSILVSGVIGSAKVTRRGPAAQIEKAHDRHSSR